MAKVQIIRDAKGAPAFAVVPWSDYRRMAGSAAEDAQDIAAAEAALADAERFPADVARRIAAGENVLKVIREWRGLSQDELAKRAKFAKQYISQLETGRRSIGHKTARALAPALNTGPDIFVD